MSYQVLARRWRPQSFQELVGQEHVATTLLNALRTDRMPHALLFTGSRGVGKTSAARILAKSLRCSHAVDFVPCNQCDDCTEISQGRSIDVIEIDGASNNGVESIRELRETVGYMPSHGRYKVYIIDEVHMLSTSAFNALLKTLEEPPAHVVFVFATTEVQKIPVTILSRCQRFDFRRIPLKRIVERLEQIAKVEGIETDSQSLWLMARESEGSMRDSQSLFDQVITFCGKQVTHDKVVQVLGLTDRTLLSSVLKAILARNAATILQAIKRVFEAGYDAKQFAQDVMEELRHLMVVKVGGGADFLDLPQQEIDELTQLAQMATAEDIHFLFDMALKGVLDVVRAQDPQVVLEMLLFRLAQAPQLTSVQELLHLARQSSGAPVTSTPPTPAASAPAAPHSAGTGGDSASSGATASTAAAPATPLAMDWETVIRELRRDKPLLAAKLEYGAYELLENGRWSLTFRKEHEFFYNQVRSPALLAELNDWLEKKIGHRMEWDVRLGPLKAGQSLSLHEQKKENERERRDTTRREVEGHPLIKDAQEILKAKITSIEEKN